MFLFVSRQQTSPCELQLAWWEYMKILTSCPVVCSLPRHSRSLYRAGWPARRKSEWTAQSSAREKNNRGIILFVLLRKKWPSKMTMIECGKLWASWSGTKHYVVIILTDAGTVIWFNIGWNEIFCITISVFATIVYISHVEDKICCPGNLCSRTVLHYDAVLSHILSLMWKTVHHVSL